MDARKITADQVRAIATKYGVEYAAVMAIVDVESSGDGFNPPTGKIIIRFEPSWFMRLSKVASQHLNEAWHITPNGPQVNEWQKFNSAFAIDPNAAMMATSVGMMQVMGFHYADHGFGFANVGAMWDFAKVNEANQVDLGLRFIASEPALLRALRAKDWQMVAYYYNGQDYRQNNYDINLKNAYNKYV